MTMSRGLTSALAIGTTTLMSITAFSGGPAQAEVSRASHPPQAETSTPAPALSVGHTRFEIRNETGATIELYAYQDGKVGNPLHKVAALGDQGLWYNTASNSAADASKDHNIVVFSRGKPVMRVTADNPPIGYPEIVAHYAKAGSKNGKVGGGLSVNEAHTHTDIALLARFNRGCDIDSGAWYRANTKSLAVSLQSVPNVQYSTDNDQGGGGIAPA